MAVWRQFYLGFLLLSGPLSGQVYAQHTQPLTLAGNYQRGGMFESASLKLSGSRHFEYTFFTDDGGSQLSSAGRYQVNDAWITLLPKSYKSYTGKEKISNLPRRLLAVRWGQRLYMLRKNELLDFCHEVNLGEEPFNPPTSSEESNWPSKYFTRQGDMQRAASGWPELPAKLRCYLLLEPLYGRVTKVQRGEVFTIDVGKRDGLRLGMIFTHRENEHNHDFKVVWLGERIALLKNR